MLVSVLLDRGEPVPIQGSYRVCDRSAAKEFYLHGIDETVRSVGLDGLYLDGTAEVGGGCRNCQHGCGYLRKDGTVAPTYAIFPTREIMQRIYAIVKKRNAEGQVVFHQSGEMIASNLAWCMSYYDGEQWQNGKYVSTSPAGCYTSLWRHPKNGVLAVVANLGRKEVSTEFQFNLGKLGLTGSLSVEDARTGERLPPMEEGKARLTLPSMGWRLVWLKPQR